MYLPHMCHYSGLNKKIDDGIFQKRNVGETFMHSTVIHFTGIYIYFEIYYFSMPTFFVQFHNFTSRLKKSQYFKIL